MANWLPEWLVEDGIGEQRAICLHQGAITAARIAWPGELAPGQIVGGVLVSRSAGAARGIVRLDDGQEALIDKLPRSASEGALLNVLIIRQAMAEQGRGKLPQVRAVDEAPGPALSLVTMLQDKGRAVQVVGQFPDCDWEDLIEEALAGQVGFAGGMLTFSATPAMTVVDVDGTLPPPQLALAAIAPLARSLQRFDLAGSVGIDFPTLTTRPERKAVDDALEQALGGWPHARTAMNGFGFVQIVARLDRMSLLHRAQFRRAQLIARQLLRRAERLSGAGAIELSGHPALTVHLTPPLLDALARRSGREVRWRADQGLALERPHAQFVPR